MSIVVGLCGWRGCSDVGVGVGVGVEVCSLEVAGVDLVEVVELGIWDWRDGVDGDVGRGQGGRWC